MPKVIRIALTPEQRADLNRRARARELAPRLRDRLEMVRLSDLGWSIPRIAVTLGTHEQTVRKYIKAFLAGGFDALPDRPRSGRPPAVSAADLAALEQVLDESAASGRTWTLAQQVRWLAAIRGVSVSAGHLRRLLHARRFRWKRTKRSVRHKQKDPTRQAQAEADLATLHLCKGQRQPA